MSTNFNQNISMSTNFNKNILMSPNNISIIEISNNTTDEIPSSHIKHIDISEPDEDSIFNISVMKQFVKII